jgi:hypothetical protein
MLEDYYVKPSTIDRVRRSWLAPQIESYLEWLQAHGYSRLVVYCRLPLLFQFAEFAQKKGSRDIAPSKAYIKENLDQKGITSFSELSPAVLSVFIVEHGPKMAPRNNSAAEPKATLRR